MKTSVILLLLTMTCAWMGAIGWYVGLVHYPAFRDIQPDRWAAFHASHSMNTGILVGGPMLAQFFLTLMLPFCKDPALPQWLWISCVVCLALSFGWTMVVSGPLHGPLSSAQDIVIIDKLIATNSPRALFWTLEALLAGFGLIQLMK